MYKNGTVLDLLHSGVLDQMHQGKNLIIDTGLIMVLYRVKTYFIRFYPDEDRIRSPLSPDKVLIKYRLVMRLHAVGFVG